VALLQAPLRSLIAITIPILSRAWKQKDHREISRIYKRSSINLLSFALLLFFCIWLNYTQAISFFGINQSYLEARDVFFILGITTIIEMGTGVNSQIISTSAYWRFELWTSLLLTILIIPLSYFLTIKYGLIGPAFANLISFAVYNSVRYYFLLKKFSLQPFSKKTLEVLAMAILLYLLVYFTMDHIQGIIGLLARTALYTTGFLALMYYRNISPDMKPIIDSIKKRLGMSVS
jgi:O-antigen/teichoic acid export membrane protein